MAWSIVAAMTETAFDDTRFLDAQRAVYRTALAELREGRKRTHWMWFIFPQLRGLGFTRRARFYGIADPTEAVAYATHPVLGARLRECTQTVLVHAGQRTASEIFGHPDDLKFRSCLTLFAAVAPHESLWTHALDAFYAGSPDRETQRILGELQRRLHR